jgi:CDGSH-type Zn-finger protein
MPVKITVRDNGPLRIEGDDFELYDAKGEKFSAPGREYISLCRCGQSSNKPFCDGTHGRCGFQSVEIARVLPPPPPSA